MDTGTPSSTSRKKNRRSSSVLRVLRIMLMQVTPWQVTREQLLG